MIEEAIIGPRDIVSYKYHIRRDLQASTTDKKKNSLAMDKLRANLTRRRITDSAFFHLADNSRDGYITKKDRTSHYNPAAAAAVFNLSFPPYRAAPSSDSHLPPSSFNLSFPPHRPHLAAAAPSTHLILTAFTPSPQSRLVHHSVWPCHTYEVPVRVTD